MSGLQLTGSIFDTRAITGHGCSSKDDISKKDSDQARQWSYF